MTVRRLGVLLGAALLLVATGCGIAPESSAHLIAPDDVPFDLIDATPTSSAPAMAGGVHTVFFVRGRHLAPFDRSLSTPQDLDELLEVLSLGPTREEQAAGVASSLPKGEIASVSITRGVARVDLKPTFPDLRSRDQPLAIAQIVFTLTGQPGVGRVSFTLNGEGVEIPRGDGALTTDALARDDFAELAPAT